MANMSELVAEARKLTAEKKAAEERLEAAIDSVNKARNEQAAEIARKRLGISAGTFIQDRDGHLIQVESVGAEQLSEWSFGDKSNAKDVEASRLFAVGVRINRASGKPVMTRGSGRYGSPQSITEQVNLIPNQIKIVPPEEVATKRKKTEKSDAIKRLESLSPDQLAAVLKKAGV